jgi:hypothetical protein
MARINREKLLEYLDREPEEELRLAPLLRYCLIDRTGLGDEYELD